MKRLALLFLGTMVFLMPRTAAATVFDVTDAATFQTALTTAQGNGQADTINVAAGFYAVAAELTYLPLATENFGLTIVGSATGVAELNAGPFGRILNISTTAVAGDANADILIQRLTFRSGLAQPGSGGGLLVQTVAADVRVEFSLFDTNNAVVDGGGMQVQTAAGAISVVGNTFTNNTAVNDGGGMRVFSTGGGGVLVRDNRFTDNTGNRDGGGARAETTDGSLVMVNNIFFHNTANGDGGGLRAESVNGAVRLVNNTVTENTAFLSGGGAIVKLTNDLAPADLSNNILRGNVASGPLGGGDVFLDNDQDNNVVGSPVTLANNDVTSTAAAILATVTSTNNIDAPPLLTADFHLLAGSPCIDAGLSTAVSIPTLDLDGQPRIAGAAVDIGADEFSTVVPPGTQPAFLTLAARPRRIAAGGLAILKGKLADAAGAGIAGKRVRIRVGTRTVKTLTTGVHGGFAFRVRLLRTRRFTASFRGDATFQPAVSRVVRIVVVP